MMLNKDDIEIYYPELFLPFNKMGYAFENLSIVGKEFLEYCKLADAPVLDVGAAFGVATIKALKQGAYVIANDAEQNYLEITKANTPLNLRKRLELKVGKFPHLNFEEGSLSAIFISQVLHFLSHKDAIFSFEAMLSWLKPTGKIFVITATPYISMFKNFIPHFEQCKRKKNLFPGYIIDLFPQADELQSKLSKEILLMDLDLLKELALSTNFTIEKTIYIPRPDFPSEMQLDGRENVGLIASKLI